MRLPGDDMRLPGEGLRLPGDEKPAERPARKPAEKPSESPQPAVPTPSPTAPEGSLPGLQQPESPVPPAAKENPVTPLLPMNKEQAPAPSKDSAPAPSKAAAQVPSPPTPAKQGDQLPADPDIPEAPEAPLPPDHSLLPSRRSQVCANQRPRTRRGKPAGHGQPRRLACAVIGPERSAAQHAGRIAGRRRGHGNAGRAARLLPGGLGRGGKWVRGDPRWSVVCAGHVFLLSGPEQQQRFRASVGRYLPGFAGDDAVQAVRQRPPCAGKTRAFPLLWRQSISVRQCRDPSTLSAESAALTWPRAGSGPRQPPNVLDWS